MDIFVKILTAVLAAASLILVFIITERRLARIRDVRWKLLGRSLLYSLIFTPTIYHHAPNTIIAPLHLSTICGNLFYEYDYTPEMILGGVIIPLMCGWAVVTFILLFKLKFPHTYRSGV